MPWTQSQQIAVESTAAGFASEYATAVNTWTNAIQAGGGAAVAEARVQDVIQRWEGFVQNLQNSSDIVTSNESAMDKLGQLASQLADDKQTLARLKSEANTRGEQADSVNPKTRPSPYTNILGLQRMFRPSTRHAILVVSIIFGVLSVGLMGYLGYAMITKGVMVPSFVVSSDMEGGGGRRPRATTLIKNP
jgi:hypothetical protein